MLAGFFDGAGSYTIWWLLRWTLTIVRLPLAETRLLS